MAVVTSAVVATFVVARHLGTKPLWRDEAITVSVAARPALRILSILPHHDANAGLFYLLLHFWLWFGDGATWARALSSLCFVATAALVAWAGGRWRGWETGLASGLLVALNPFLVYYGQEARPYALAALLATISTIALFWRWDDSGLRPAPRVYLVATVALLYVDLFAVLFVATLAGVLVAFLRSRHQRVPAALKRSWWLAAAATAPLAVVMVVFESGQISWLPRPSAGVLERAFTSMSSGWLGLEVVGVLAAVAFVAASAAAAAAPAAAAAAAAAARDRVIIAALAAAFALPPLVLWVVGQLTPAFIDRYLICGAVAMVALTGAGLAALRDRLGLVGRLAAVAVLGGLLLLSGRRVARMEAAPFKVDDAPAVVNFIQSRSQPGDALAYAGGGLRTVIEASLPTPAAGVFPTDIALAPGGEAFLQNDLYAREISAPELKSRLAAVNRLWLVTDPLDQRYPLGGPFADLKPLVLATFGSGATTSFGAIDVTLLVRHP